MEARAVPGQAPVLAARCSRARPLLTHTLAGGPGSPLPAGVTQMELLAPGSNLAQLWLPRSAGENQQMEGLSVSLPLSLCLASK